MNPGRAPYRATADQYLTHYSGDPTEAGCIEWTGVRNPQGYGQVGAALPERAAHRLAWHVHHGPIPPGLVIRHSCDNPPCVNVEHLLIGTTADNNRDRAERGRNRKPNLDRLCPYGHDMRDPTNIIQRTSGGVDCRTCHRAAQAKWRAKRRAEDPEGFARAAREATARWRASHERTSE